VETDFNALASRVAALGELRACIILSRDGLVLGVFPPRAEAEIRPAWLRVTNLGEPERGFIEFPTETWVFLRRGPYTAFAVGLAGARPGVMLDHLEQALLVAEEGRRRREAVRGPDRQGRPRSALHREPRAVQPPAGQPPAGQPPATPTSPAAPVGPASPERAAAIELPPDEPPTDGPPREVPIDDVPQPKDVPLPWTPSGEEDDEVDRISLAFELSNLLQESQPDDE
jgi:hypothetical protein